MNSEALIVVAAPWLTLLSGLVIPLVVGLVTKLEASTGTKSVVTVVLAALAGAAQVLVAGGGVVSGDYVIQTVITLGLALGSFYGIYSPAKTDARLAPGFGIGPSD